MSPADKKLLSVTDDLISISEAAKLTPYSSEYLSLLARKGKLKAVKISRDWLTTKEAVLEYVKKQAAKHEKMLSGFQAAGFLNSSGGIGVYYKPARVRAASAGKTNGMASPVSERGRV